MLAFIIKMIVSGENTLEKVIRIFALIVGFLLYFTTRAIGISIPQLVVNSLVGITPIYFGIVVA